VSGTTAGRDDELTQSPLFEHAELRNDVIIATRHAHKPMLQFLLLLLPGRSKGARLQLLLCQLKLLQSTDLAPKPCSVCRFTVMPQQRARTKDGQGKEGKFVPCLLKHSVRASYDL
jgi:hypothetical protein